MLDAILFDLDGTLLPMDTEGFIKAYLGLIAKTAMKWGYKNPEETVGALWKGVVAMIKNNGERANDEAFWEAFSKTLGRDCTEDIPKFDKFYETEFRELSALVHPTTLAKEAVEEARKKAKHVILASNPVFPLVAAKTRLGWAGVSPDSFDWITNYSNSTACKPNPWYYKEILERFDINPERALMVGNDVGEDYLASKEVGVSSFIIKDYLINKNDDEINCPNGTFADMVEYLKSL